MKTSTDRAVMQGIVQRASLAELIEAFVWGELPTHCDIMEAELKKRSVDTAMLAECVATTTKLFQNGQKSFVAAIATAMQETLASSRTNEKAVLDIVRKEMEKARGRVEKIVLPKNIEIDCKTEHKLFPDLALSVV